jgi:major type 1 subunit fimbrin (pilin)
MEYESMKSKLALLLALTGAAAISQSAFAADGTITFNGNITAQTCTISGNGSGPNFTVALPTVSASTLSTAGATAGRSPFNIALTNCTPDSGTVHTFFEQGPTIDTTTGNLVLNAGGATNVQIQLQNSDFSNIALNQPDSGQNSKTVPIQNGAATLHYYAQYIATGKAGAGAANSSVMYTMSYQ